MMYVDVSFSMFNVLILLTYWILLKGYKNLINIDISDVMHMFVFCFPFSSSKRKKKKKPPKNQKPKNNRLWSVKCKKSTHNACQWWDVTLSKQKTNPPPHTHFDISSYWHYKGITMDAGSLEFADDYFDVIIDKGVMIAFAFCFCFFLSLFIDFFFLFLFFFFFCRMISMLNLLFCYHKALLMQSAAAQRVVMTFVEWI